jgi:hypothetical protein
LEISPEYRERLEAALGRTLDDTQLAQIADAVDVYRQWFVQRDHEVVSQQDKIRTLLAIAAAPPRQVPAALQNCDGWTEAEISTQLYLDGATDFIDTAALDAEFVRQAAARAAARLKAKRPPGGRRSPGHRPYLVASALMLFHELKASNTKVDLASEESPAVAFAEVLFEVVEAPRAPGAGMVLKLLRKGQKPSR